MRDLVLPLRARGEHQDGEIAPVAAQTPDQFETRQFGQAQVDDGQVHRKLLAQVKPFTAVRRCIDRKTGLAQLAGQGFEQAGIVFDNEYAHAIFLRPGSAR
jgi:hypothetical protein